MDEEEDLIEPELEDVTVVDVVEPTSVPCLPEPKKEPYEMIYDARVKLTEAALDTALTGEIESNRVAMLKWCLERIPELAPKHIEKLQQIVNVQQLTAEDAERINRTAEKLIRVTEILKKGNPHVEKKTARRETVELDDHFKDADDTSALDECGEGEPQE